MTRLTNVISIDASPGTVWAIVADLGALADYDPTVKAVEVTCGARAGQGATRRVTMRDGKHWFEERLAALEPDASLTYELTACNFPIARLQHTYTFAHQNGSTVVTQVMEYTPKFGWAGRLLDAAMLRRGFNAGVIAFLGGLKARSEGPTPAADAR
ncbi:MAG TPA: SRPBCC family protein [Mycobacteriales bacterium]|nr:SRPBCC family protein [Mycobacteriales bacterium]